MIPKEKAKEIIEKYKTKVSGHSAIKQCALIAVDEILNIYLIKNASFEFYEVKNYWEEVKNEINKL